MDGRIKLWELGGRESAAGYGHTGKLSAVAVSADGKLLATGGDDNSVRLWDLTTAKELFVMNGHTAEVTALGGLLKMVPPGLVRGAAEKVVNDAWNRVTEKLAAGA